MIFYVIYFPIYIVTFWPSLVSMRAIYGLCRAHKSFVNAAFNQMVYRLDTHMEL